MTKYVSSVIVIISLLIFNSCANKSIIAEKDTIITINNTLPEGKNYESPI